jgi:hypothetical protein
MPECPAPRANLAVWVRLALLATTEPTVLMVFPGYQDLRVDKDHRDLREILAHRVLPAQMVRPVPLVAFQPF